MYKAGVDIGSVMAKAVIMHGDNLLAYYTKPVGGNFYKAAHDTLDGALAKANLHYDSLGIIGTTGLGASFLTYPNLYNTEVACQARGMKYLFPSARIVIEVGDQSTRVIKLTEHGKIADCVINDRCAAGSGRTLLIIAKVLRLSIDQMGDYSIMSTNPVRFGTSCSVFTETEAISRIAEGIKKEDIIAGLHHSMAIKIYSMVQKVKLEENCAMTGGGAKDKGLVAMLEKALGKRLLVHREPFISGAIGAAIMASVKT
ncbi:CoA-substrate-specific enzyme activase, putative [Desulfotomaculum arcticum]|uniref:CoA-substrate-specific enzyme activase, putative n=1 Tax=Desulfotruncus arcticus DSM 17038 TaxID=1121424 RepID=A0A1I2XLK3_9FIRM|nr:acyl-CoA dehydratase activase [Desulfotruncus arcticus]SFH14374.1 CoA-substrate-specific enzyme activase, putative [Desulfotomaculum arcticum] [Desulfotruncus arcticus DSM 17038]